MTKQLKKGDKVEWSTSQGKTTGTVKKKLTSAAKIKGHKVAASRLNPEYLVESEKGGGKAAHKANVLRKVSKSGTAKKSPKNKSESKFSKGGTAKNNSKSASTKKFSASATGTKKKASSGSGTEKSSSSKPGSKKKAGSVKPTVRKASSSKSLTDKKTSPLGTAKKAAAKSASKRSESKEDQVIAEFKTMMNIPLKELIRWLDTTESKKVGFKENGKGESVEHESGRKIPKILAKRKDRYTNEDVKHIHKVVGYIKRHLAQKPKGDISASNWRYSLMNWGHDPTK